MGKLMLTCAWLRIFRDTLMSIFVFVNENCCLCKCFTVLYIFFILSTLSCNFNPLSPNNFLLTIPIHCQEIRIWELTKITKEKIPWSYIKFSQLTLKGNAWRPPWRICMLILALKGLIAVPVVFSRTWTSLAGVLKMLCISNAFKVYT